MSEHKIELETGGTVWKVLVKQGDTVADGQELFIMEVMKMEVPYTAPASGVVTALNIAEGDVMQEGQTAATVATGS
ncbi:acetyl-CoA carboxylase biotin carboxyl carrier protein subunit [Henriciella sp.]|uniref:acetyl-CoA carboxylase biotin carboxyl carrier protein subunit n=1 Tax=Henriciella sp. TaxID=1968823 RepID=UPI00262DD99D|nr:acetyl-CoA carboxylase biotin carboxyl carrier protein subunit [Henriciella sp.]